MRNTSYNQVYYLTLSRRTLLLGRGLSNFLFVQCILVTSCCRKFVKFLSNFSCVMHLLFVETLSKICRVFVELFMCHVSSFCRKFVENLSSYCRTFHVSCIFLLPKICRKSVNLLSNFSCVMGIPSCTFILSKLCKKCVELFSP